MFIRMKGITVSQAIQILKILNYQKFVSYKRKMHSIDSFMNILTYEQLEKPSYKLKLTFFDPELKVRRINTLSNLVKSALELRDQSLF